MNRSNDVELVPLIERALEVARTQATFPESTYRLQLHKDFDFKAATEIVPYLAKLGVTHVYASPYLKARPGSMHGYDVIDHSEINPELGGEQGFEAWATAMKNAGLSHIVDVVPNHVGVGTNDNPWWNDVLENGPASVYASYFDIAWQSSPRPELHDRVLLPVLGRPYAAELEEGKLRVGFEGGAFYVAYHERKFPLSPRTYAWILGGDEPQGMEAAGKMWSEYESICWACQQLPTRCNRKERRHRHREKEIIKRRLARLYEQHEEVRRRIDANIELFNGRPGDVRSFDRLDHLLHHQAYRLSYWHVASDEINYRRFFDVTDLAGISMERREVFLAAHRVILKLLAEGKVSGLRIDHPDGLVDPRTYFERLQRHYVSACAERLADGNVAEEVITHLKENPEMLRPWPLYVVAEKILAMDEPLPESWAVSGTSGYDFLNYTNGVFVDRAMEGKFTEQYEKVTGEKQTFEELAYGCKRIVLSMMLSSELQMLAHRLDRIAQTDRHSRDFTLRGLRTALREMIACFPVYRSYVAEGGTQETDAQRLDTAVEEAAKRNPRIDRSIFHFIRNTLLLNCADGSPATKEEREERVRFAGKFQQLTSPVTAKGIEDTAFYRFNRFVSLNEVGGEPARFGITPEELHDYFKHRAKQWPHALSTLSTHDTKRSEDVRARLNVLCEYQEEWEEQVNGWMSQIGEVAANDAYLLFQTLVGSWPLSGDADETYLERIKAYMRKALREAKVNTTWAEPNEAYEGKVFELVERCVRGDMAEEVAAFAKKLMPGGLLNSLAQTAIRLMAPGVPDTYQGMELWDFSLVDPDNRRPVDFGMRVKMLGEKVSVEDAVERPEDGRVKMLVTVAALKLRRERPGLLTEGEYEPVVAEGEKARCVLGFVRRHEGKGAVLVVPRLASRWLEGEGMRFDGEGWRGTSVQLPQGRWRHVITGEEWEGRIELGELLGRFPVGMLESV